MAYRTTTEIHTIDEDLPRHRASDLARTRAEAPVRQAYRILLGAYIVLPVVAGIDKFFYRLTDWSQYLAPAILDMVPVTSREFMMGVGVVEVLAGLLVAFRPSVGGLIVALWLWGIDINLLLIPNFLDIAARDFALSLGALAQSRLARRFDR